MSDQEEQRLEALAGRFGLVIAEARGEGADIADVATAMSEAFGLTLAAIKDQALALHFIDHCKKQIWRAYHLERQVMEKAEAVVYRGGFAARRRRPR